MLFLYIYICIYIHIYIYIYLYAIYLRRVIRLVREVANVCTFHQPTEGYLALSNIHDGAFSAEIFNNF